MGNSVLLEGDAVDAVRRMKGGDEDLGIIGSGALVRALARAGLVDEFLLLVHPLVLGTGQRLFARRRRGAARSSTPVTTTTGRDHRDLPRQRGGAMRQYLLSVYQPAGDPPPPEVLEQMIGATSTPSTATSRRRGRGSSPAACIRPSTATVLRARRATRCS